jgi:predicted double-glycine peptidase
MGMTKPLAWLSLTALAALSALQASAMPQPRLPANHLPIPVTPQATEYSCGPAAVLSILSYFGIDQGPERELHSRLKTTKKDGTHPRDIAAAAPALGLEAKFQMGLTLADLRAALQRRIPMILDIQAWPDKKLPAGGWKDHWDDGHYVVLIAMDENYAYFMDPSTRTGYGFIPLPELMDRWHDVETRYGTVEKHIQAAIFFRANKAPLPRFPDFITKVE